DGDEKEYKKHDGVPNGNQQMLVRGSAEDVAKEPHARTEPSYRQSCRAPGDPSRKACRHYIESRYCPLATRKIINEAENNCQCHSSGSRNHFRSHIRLSPSFHLELRAARV